MGVEGWIGIGSILLSIFVAVRGLRKDKAEVVKIGAETYGSYQEALEKAQKNYDSLVESTDKRFMNMEKKYNDVLIHNRALIDQLIENKIVPITLEQAINKSKGVSNA